MKKKINTDLLIFALAAACITASFLLAYTPRAEVEGARSIQNLSLFKDDSGTLSIEDVRANGDLFFAHPKPTVYSKRTTTAFWLRFSVADEADEWEKSRRYIHIPNASLENIDVFFPNEQIVQAGKKQPSANLAIKSRTWNIPIPADVTESGDIYVRVQTNTIMWIPLRILTTTEVLKHIQEETLLFGSFFGILFAIFFINLFSFIIVKNKNFLIYLLYLVSLILYHLRVHGYLYLLPIPFVVLEIILWLSLGGVGVFMILFACYFLDLKKRSPIMNKILLGSIAFFAVQTLLGVFQQAFLANQIAYITGFIVPLMIISTTTKIYFQGHREARYYLLAWAALFTATLIWSTTAYAEAQIPANYFFLAGTTIDSLLFTLAIFDLIRKQLSEHQQGLEREKYYQDLSRTDPLTGLYNRRYLNEIIKRLDTDNELPDESSLVMLDLDNFKAINDTYGHLTGDIILTKTGAKLKKYIRKSDIACRYGGDEFLIFLPGAGAEAANSIAENIRNDIINDVVYSEEGDPVRITISMGISGNRMNDTFDGLFLRADAALYQAKKTGRDKIVIL